MGIENMKGKPYALITGWCVFIISFTVYNFTLEPTTSFWDCSEFILSAAKLEVNHPSGAPLFMLIGRIFSLFSFGNPQKIAWAVNLMSAFFSAFTIYFLFQSIIFLAKKVSSNPFHIIGTAIIGALTFAFTDSFWFSAVEAEVYGLSMFFLSISFWAILKWEEGYATKGNERWILFIALITGLGLGVHLLNLLIIPSIVMVICFKRFGFSSKVVLGAFILGCITLLSVLYIITPSVLYFLSRVELLVVNSFHLPVNSGVISGVAILALILALGIRYFNNRQKRIVSLAILSITLLLIGFSVYSVNMVRSQAGTPVNFGQPDNIFSLIDYLNREQYPKRPLLYGQNFNSQPVGVKKRYTKGLFDGKYKTIELPSQYEYLKETCTFFPRMYSAGQGHIEAYKNWVNIKGEKVRVRMGSGEVEILSIPTLGENILFFLRFQLGYMYGRYFMWNFAGRQNDIQGMGGPLRGNWVSGVKPIDSIRLGTQEGLPKWLTQNKARNRYFFLPLALGLVGLVFHFKSGKSAFFVVLTLFIMAGAGLVVYINEIPIVPRERDYVFVGSFMAFSIWVGFGFMGLSTWVRKRMPLKPVPILVFSLVLLGSPALLLFQNYDDHDRSGRYSARDFAANILNSCPENAILFTSGDNDTYPLLYCQEVEGVRQDVRLVIMPFLSANWFIDQLKSRIYENDGLAMALPQKKIDGGSLDYVYVKEKIKRRVSLKEVMDFIKSDDPATLLKTDSGKVFGYIPANNVFFTVKTKVSEGKVPISFEGKNVVFKHELVFWDIISSNAQKRPICFVSKAEADKHGLLNYIKREGLVCQLVPEKNTIKNIMGALPCDPDKLYSQIMHQFEWGNVDDPEVYVDYNTIYNASVFQLRNVFNNVAEVFINKGEKLKAQKVLQRAALLFLPDKFPYDMYSLRQTELILKAGMDSQAENQLGDFLNSTKSNLEYYQKLGNGYKQAIRGDVRKELFYLERLARIIRHYKLKGTFPEAREEFNRFYSLYEKRRP